MQLLTASPREGESDARMRALLNADDLTVDFGADLLDLGDQFVASLRDDVSGGSVKRSNYADVHGACELTLSRELAWGRDRVQPYQVLSSDVLGVSARFNLGVFVLTTPQRTAGEFPGTFSVAGFDKLHLLQPPIGDTYEVPAGTGYLDAVRAAVTASGAGGRVLLDSTAAGKALEKAMTWPLIPETGSAGATSWLSVVNDLLAAIGYRGLWVDENGAFRSEPYVAPAARAVEWTLDADDKRTSLVGVDRTRTQDVWNVANRWVFIRRGMDTPPVNGDGIYRVENAAAGITSHASLGRWVTSVVELDAADQASLVSQGDRRVATDTSVAAVLEITTAPLPVLGHFDVMTYADTDLGGSRKVLARSWELPLDGSDGRLELEEVG